MLKVHCKGCDRLILQKTALRYQGYSRQCLAKNHYKVPLTEPIQIQTSKTEISQEDIRFYLAKTHIKFPKLYYFQEFCKIWSLTGSSELAEYYYKRYLSQLALLVKDLPAQKSFTNNYPVEVY